MSISAVNALEAVTREVAPQEAHPPLAHTGGVQTAREVKCEKLFVIKKAAQILAIAE